jgi:hypothetical protein
VHKFAEYGKIYRLNEERKLNEILLQVQVLTVKYCLFWTHSSPVVWVTRKLVKLQPAQKIDLTSNKTVKYTGVYSSISFFSFSETHVYPCVKYLIKLYYIGHFQISNLRNQFIQLIQHTFLKQENTKVCAVAFTPGTRVRLNQPTLLSFVA